jgi:hypothetical protein
MEHEERIESGNTRESGEGAEEERGAPRIAHVEVIQPWVGNSQLSGVLFFSFYLQFKFGTSCRTHTQLLAT